MLTPGDRAKKRIVGSSCRCAADLDPRLCFSRMPRGLSNMINMPESKSDARVLIPRRKWMAQMAALGAGAALPKSIWGSRQGSAPPAFRIDTHHHFTIPKLYALSTAKGVSQPTLKDWTPEKSLEEMEQGGVATSIISISDPGVRSEERRVGKECRS